MVQRIRNGGSLPSCTSKSIHQWRGCGGTAIRVEIELVAILGNAVVVKAQRSSFRIQDLDPIVLFREAAFANMATNRRPACRAAILRILMEPTPPNTADASVASPVFPRRFWKPVSQIRYIVIPWRAPHNSFPLLEGFGRTDSPAGHRPRASPSPFLGIQCRHLHQPFSGIMAPGKGRLERERSARIPSGDLAIRC